MFASRQITMSVNPETTPVDQTEIDRIQMMAGLEIGQSLIELARLNPERFNKEELSHELVLLMTPQRLKDSSCDEIREKILQHYITEASLAMIANYMKGELIVLIPPKHQTLVAKLVDHWISKNFTAWFPVGVDKDGNTAIHIEWCL